LGKRRGWSSFNPDQRGKKDIHSSTGGKMHKGSTTPTKKEQKTIAGMRERTPIDLASQRTKARGRKKEVGKRNKGKRRTSFLGKEEPNTLLRKGKKNRFRERKKKGEPPKAPSEKTSAFIHSGWEEMLDSFREWGRGGKTQPTVIWIK